MIVYTGIKIIVVSITPLRIAINFNSSHYSTVMCNEDEKKKFINSKNMGDIIIARESIITIIIILLL